MLACTGGKVTRDAGPVKGGQRVIAFVEDPTGYKWELLTRKETKEPIAQVGPTTAGQCPVRQMCLASYHTRPQHRQDTAWMHRTCAGECLQSHWYGHWSNKLAGG